MKKITVTLIVSFLITLAGLLINYLSFKDQGDMPLAIKHFGGEITVMTGFGLKCVHIYAMTPEAGDSVSLSFSIVSFVLTFLLIAAIIYVLLSLFRLFKN